MRRLIVLLIVLIECESATIDDLIEKCILDILAKHFPNQPILLITDLTIDKEDFHPNLIPDLGKEYHREMILEVMKKEQWTVQIYNTDKYLGLPPRLKLSRLKNTVLFIRSEIINSDKLFNLEMNRLYRNPLWNPTGRTLIILKGSRNESSEIARKVIEKLWSKSKAVDNLVMIADDKSIHFYTWYPYRQPDCSKVKTVVKMDTYTGRGFHVGANLFPEKVDKNLHGCELIAATETCIPYVFADEHNASRFVDGFELNIIQTLSELLNFKLRTIRPRYMWTTSINKTLMGAFKMLVEQRVDLAFSCLMINRERNLLALALPSYYEDALVWFVPSPTFKSHATDIFYSFSEDFWLVMIFVMISATILVTALVYFERGSGYIIPYILKLIGVSIYGPINVPTERYHFRLFVFLFFLYSMHITIAFQSSLFSLYRQPQYNKIYKSLEEVVEDELFVYLRSANQALYNQSDHGLWKRILQPGKYDYLRDFGEAFSEIAYDKTAVALFIKTTGIYMISMYFTDEYGTPQIRWLREKFAPYPVTTFLSPGNPLFSLFEVYILRLLASGLVGVWLDRATLSGRLHFEVDGFVNEPLTMEHMGGAFFLLLLLLFIAVVMFVGEVVVFKVKKRAEERKKPPHRFHPNVKVVVKGYERSGRWWC